MRLKAIDEELLELLKGKNDEAFERVYHETKNGVFAIIHSLVRDLSTSEDLMQDTYIKMIKHINSYQKGRNFNAWLQQIAKNTAYDYLRKNRHEMKSDIQSDHDSILATGEIDRDQDVDVEKLMNLLSDTERQIVEMKIVGAMTFQEIASLIKKPLGTVFSVYRKAIKKIKNTYERSQHET